MTDLPDLAPTAKTVAALLPQVADDQLESPTPCGDSPLSVVLFHLIGLSAAFIDAARKDLGATTATPPDQVEPALPSGWRFVGRLATHEDFTHGVSPRGSQVSGESGHI